MAQAVSFFHTVSGSIPTSVPNAHIHAGRCAASCASVARRWRRRPCMGALTPSPPFPLPLHFFPTPPQPAIVLLSNRVDEASLESYECPAKVVCVRGIRDQDIPQQDVPFFLCVGTYCPPRASPDDEGATSAVGRVGTLSDDVLRQFPAPPHTLPSTPPLPILLSTGQAKGEFGGRTPRCQQRPV